MTNQDVILEIFNSCSFIYSSFSVLCLLPIGLPCLDRLLTDDLSSTFIVGDKGIFRVPLGVGTIPMLK